MNNALRELYFVLDEAGGRHPRALKRGAVCMVF